METLYQRTRDTLEAARERYGPKNQILVAVEELNELSCIVAKYPRYETHSQALQSLRAKVVEELGDVFNAIDHIQAIFEIPDEEIVHSASKKGDRLLLWLAQSDGPGVAIQTQVRDVPDKPCPLCVSNGSDPFKMPCVACRASTNFVGFRQRTK
jgi:NTP pyrophosphatase (non-canonical NTP hydrolase)